MPPTVPAVSRGLLMTAVALIAATGIIHLVEGPEYLQEEAYVGVLFFLNAAGAAVSAVGLLRGGRRWAWLLGVLVAGGAFVGFILSRTTGLPGFKESEWDGLGIVSLVVEAAFVAIALKALAGRRAAAGARPGAQRSSGLAMNTRS